MRWGVLVLVPVLVGGSIAACVGDSGSTPLGTEGGPCYDNGTCNAGLVCVLPNRCVRPDASAGDGGGDAATETGADASLPCIGGAIGYWPGEGTGSDALGGGLDMASINGTVTYPPGKFGTGMKTSPGWFQSLQTSAFSGLAQMTIELWIAYSSGGTIRRVVSFGDGPNLPWTLEIQSGNDIQLFVGGAESLIAKALPADGVMHHVAFTFDNGVYKGFIDGTLKDTMTGTIKVLPPLAKGYLTVGADFNGGNKFDGIVDDLAIYKVALSDTEIKALAQATAPRCRAK